MADGVLGRRHGRRAVSPVIGTILMVAITIVLAAVLYTIVSNMGSTPPQGLQLIMSTSTVTHNASNDSRNDTYLTIESKIGPGEIEWNSSVVQVIITASDATVLTDHNITIDDSNLDGKASAADRIWIRGMTGPYHGAQFRLYYDGKVVCELTLP